jgi:aryl-alcohol dehydrogenase-like predicted oxidoreductase
VTPGGPAARLGLGLAALGRPAYITSDRGDDLGPADGRSVDRMRERAHGMLDAAWAAGIRYVDAARSYGLAEEFLGAWFAAHPERRTEMRVGSKWGYTYVGEWRLDAAVHERKDHALAAFERQWPETRAALGSPPDVYLVHSVTPESTALTDPALHDALRRLAGDGVRVGISTSGPAQREVVERALGIADSPFAAVQSTWNLWEQSAAPALRAAHDAGWLVVVKEVLANGRLRDGVDDPAVAAAASRAGVPVDVLAVSGALAMPWADVVLTGAVTAEQLGRNLRAEPVEVSPAWAREPAAYWSERSELAWS